MLWLCRPTQPVPFVEVNGALWWPVSADSRPRLDVVVAGHCLACASARRMARAVMESFPDLDVRILDVDVDAIPAAVVATPTYLLDGRVISLGNPRREELWARLREVAA